MDVALLTLLHILVLVYWLGADLGAFAASGVITNGAAAPAARVAAGRLLADLDMAPRSALILAAPTGLALAIAQGWLSAPGWLLIAAIAAALLWLALAWRVHLTHAPPRDLWRRLDLLIRWAVLIGLVLIAAAMLAERIEAPLFIALKLLILAAAVGAGLAIRAFLAPFGPAFAKIAAGKGGPDQDAIVRACLGRARPVVILLWALLLLAAFLGIWRPQ